MYYNIITHSLQSFSMSINRKYNVSMILIIQTINQIFFRITFWYMFKSESASVRTKRY